MTVGTKNEAGLSVLPNKDEAHAKALDAQFEKAHRGMVEIVVLGAALVATRDELKRRALEQGVSMKASGGLKAWMEEHLPNRNYATAFRAMQLAENAAKMAKLSGSVDIGWLLTAGAGEMSRDLENKRARLEKLLADNSQNQLLLWGGEKTSATQGGAMMLQAWLEKHHPDHAGKKLAQLPKEIRAKWEAHLEKLASDKNPEGESRRRITARDFWAELRATLHHEAQTTKHFTRLPERDLRMSVAQVKDLLAQMTEELAKV